MVRGDGLWRWAEYSTFSISDEVGKYQLTVAGYSGDAGNALMTAGSPDWVSNGSKFCTPDSDNDDNPGFHCASHRSAGWWFNACSTSELTLDNTGRWETVGETADVQASTMLLKLN